MRQFQTFLQQYQVQPAAELVAGFGHPADFRIADGLVKADPGAILADQQVRRVYLGESFQL